MDRFDRKKAAEYFIVAWVKDWKIRTYLDAIGAGDLHFEDIHDVYPWMPPKELLGFYIMNTRIQTWSARSMYGIHSRLWDMADNRRRLSLASQVERFVSDVLVTPTQLRRDRREKAAARRDAQRSELSYRVSVELMRRGSGSHWNVVK